MSSRRRGRGLALAAGILVVLAAGCATYSAKLSELRPQLRQGAYDQALQTVAKGTGGKDIVLAYLEQGMILHRAGRWVESNEALAAAERTAEELYARSLSEGALSLITNDLAISYRARPFEMAMIPYYRALNYIALGERESALVEARKTSLLLSRYIDTTLAGIERGPVSDLDRTRNDPFMLYFSAMLYEWDGELNDAFIAYRNAATAYQDLQGLLGVQIPPWLASDLERTAGRLGFGDEVEQLRAACPAVFAAAAPADQAGRRLPAGQGEVVLLVETGFVPARQEVRLDLPILESDAYQDRTAWAWDLTARAGGLYVRTDAAKIKYWLSVAVPQLPGSPPRPAQVTVRGPATGPVRGAAVHHPAAAAHITFAAEQPMILFKTVLRGLSKYLATQQADQQGKVFGLLANIFSAATESADTRSWLTLPARIHLLRLQLPAGVHALQLELADADGRRSTTQVLEVEVLAGDWTFAGLRFYSP